MATAFNITHVGNNGTLRVRYEDLVEVDDGKGKKVKKWQTGSLASILPHSQLDFFVGAGNRRVVIEEQPT